MNFEHIAGHSAPYELRFVDLCAGLGGFHRAAHLASGRAGRGIKFRCVLAAELNAELRELYVRNFPEIEDTYRELFPPSRCRESVWRDLWSERGLARIHGDLNLLIDPETDQLRGWDGAPTEDGAVIPEHDLLMAGFPCQSFSKSGAQRGFEDLNGTVFRLIAIAIKCRRPRFVLLENVGNFERHDQGNTWRRVQEVLDGLEYDIRATSHVGAGDGCGLFSPHHLGFPHHRERFFVVAQHRSCATMMPDTWHPFQSEYRQKTKDTRAQERIDGESRDRLRAIISSSSACVAEDELVSVALGEDKVACISLWNELLDQIAAHDNGLSEGELHDRIQPMPSFPIWGYELDPWRWYPFATNPAKCGDDALRTFHQCSIVQTRGLRIDKYVPGELAFLAEEVLTEDGVEKWKASWPKYAACRDEWPEWKVEFIRQNRAWALKLWLRLDRVWLRAWLERLYRLPASHQKLEWNCRGGELNLWGHILQFRPSGLRAKRFVHVPALVAMTSTQVPIVPHLTTDGLNPGQEVPGRGRYLLLREALQLQGFPTDWRLPESRSAACTALGNAVHVDLVSTIIERWIFDLVLSDEQEVVPSLQRLGHLPQLERTGSPGHNP